MRILLTGDGQSTQKGEMGSAGAAENAPVQFVWSKNSDIYHFEECAMAKRIKPENRVISKDPPEDKELHTGCPR